MILALVGEKLGGKSAVTRYLCERYGAVEIRYSSILDRILPLLGLDISRTNETTLAMALREAFGRDILARGIAHDVRNSQAPMVIMNGVRFDEEVPHLRAVDAKLVYITAPAKLRYERYKQRSEKADDAKHNFEEFVQEDATSPTEIGIPAIGKQADYTIENMGSLDELHHKIDELIKTVRH